MKRLSKVIISLVVMGAIAFTLVNNKKELNVKDIDSKKLAVFIKQEDGSYKESTSIPQMGYTLNTNKSTCSNGAKPTWINNTLNLSNLTEENTNCYLYFDEDESTKKLKEMGLAANLSTPDFSKIATTDEGIFAANDGMYGGTSYYWRGAATTNYLKFGGFCWRIIRINGDGTIRLIYDGTTCHQNGEVTTDSIAVQNVAYNTLANRSEYVGWTYVEGKQRPKAGDTAIDSNAKVQTENWYNAHLTNYSDKIADGKYCNDREVASSSIWASAGTTFNYAASKRLWTDYQPTLSCQSSDLYTLNIGLITADEVSFAGGLNADNTSYYLYNGQDYWTISPFDWNSGAVVFVMRLSGYLTCIYADVTSYGLRPVINLRSDVVLTGNGTIDNPFVVEGAE